MHNFIVAGLTEWNGSHIMPYKYATWLRAIDTHDLAVDRSIVIQVSDDRDPLNFKMIAKLVETRPIHKRPYTPCECSARKWMKL